MKRFNIKKLNKAEGKEQFPVEASNRFSALEDFEKEVEISNAWETIRDERKHQHFSQRESRIC
jgi:hypothetical protein